MSSRVQTEIYRAGKADHCRRKHANVLNSRSRRASLQLLTCTEFSPLPSSLNHATSHICYTTMRRCISVFSLSSISISFRCVLRAHGCMWGCIYTHAQLLSVWGRGFGFRFSGLGFDRGRICGIYCRCLVFTLSSNLTLNSQI